MFDYDKAISDPDNHVFTNVNQTQIKNDKSEYDYMYDDFGTQVLPDDLVMKVVFKKRKVANQKPSAENLRKVATYLETTIEELLNKEDEK